MPLLTTWSSPWRAFRKTQRQPAGLPHNTPESFTNHNVLHTMESFLQKKSEQSHRLWSYILWSIVNPSHSKLSLRDLLELAYLLEESV